MKKEKTDEEVKGGRKGRRRRGNTDLRWIKEDQVRNERIMYGWKKLRLTEEKGGEAIGRGSCVRRNSRCGGDEVKQKNGEKLK